MKTTLEGLEIKKRKTKKISKCFKTTTTTTKNVQTSFVLLAISVLCDVTMTFGQKIPDDVMTNPPKRPEKAALNRMCSSPALSSPQK